ncbi:MAG: DUF512 domain-containing protein [Chloroflexota bacterium]
MTTGGVVSRVVEGGAAGHAGLRPGDEVLAIDGVAPRDLIDVRFESLARSPVTVSVRRGGRIIEASMDTAASDLGLDFTQPTFDGLRQCNNNCEFCFIRGLPKGLRRSLYIRDDDYRYSFLFGTFTTLTNLADEDWRRIAYQRLSPLRVSVHATELSVRRRMLANADAPDILAQLDFFDRVGVEIHAQIVLCPGINDGAVLDRTIGDLAERSGVVRSVAVVPVGISDFLRTREVRAVSAGDAAATLTQVLGWHRRLRRALGRGFVYASDELFLAVGHRLPAASFYDDYAQLQNGVGLTRLLLDDWRRQRRRLPGSLARPRRVAWLCGLAAGYALDKMARDTEEVAGLDVTVKPVVNTLFGSAVGVSGLMSGADAAAALSGLDVDCAVLPRNAFGFEGERTLDDWTVARIEAESGRTVRLARTAAELIDATIGDDGA